MIGFAPKHPVVRDLLNGLWELYVPLYYQSPDGRSWLIPRNFSTDFGSVPAIVDWIIPANSSVADPAYILHDWLYHCHRIGQDQCRDRADADAILYTALLVCGVGRVKARVIYWAVRAAGGAAWGRE